MIINGRKVLSLFDDMTGGGTARWVLAGNDTMPQPWAVMCLHRDGSAEPRVVSAQTYESCADARGAFLARVAQYVSPHMSADPRFF